MRRVCAWCEKVLKPKEEYVSEGSITHGICSLCAIAVSSIKPRNEKVEESILLRIDQVSNVSSETMNVT